MNKYSYYTPEALADKIVKLLPRRKFDTVIDICCGTWNLLAAAKKKYPRADFYGVDIDESIRKYAFDGAEFILNDGRVFSNQEKMEGRTYDLILSNPPFGILEDSEVYWNKGTGVTEYSALRCKRYEAEMMLANLYLAHQNSVVVFILPITFVNGVTFKKARKQIAESFTVLEIIELPNDTFQGNELKTAAIILEKANRPRKKANYRYATLNNSNWNFSQVRYITQKEIKAGNWGTRENGKSDIRIKRGTIHSGDMNNGNNTVLHCSSIYENGRWRPSIRYTEQTSSIIAEYGDILINRIGKGAGYWCINDIPNVAISDCIFVLKNVHEDIIKKFNDNTVNGKLNVNMRGVSTRYITQSDICNIINS